MGKKGMVYLVGGGPGDPGLLTVRARQTLQKADVVVYDALVSPMIVNLAPSSAQKIFRGKRTRPGALSQEGINRLLVKLARQGKQVVRLKGGDPFVFGRGAEEAEALVRAGLEFEVIPGVTSAIAVPAYAGIPVTHRNLNSSFTVVTGHEDPTKKSPQIDWASLGQSRGTLVFLMGLHALPEVCARLVEAGQSPLTPAAIIQSGTTSRQKTVVGTLKNLPGLALRSKLRPPAVVVVGSAVKMRESLKWIQRRPLFGWRVLVTRGRLPYNSLSELLSEKGAEVIEIPTIELVGIPLVAAQTKLLKRISTFDWIVFSSANAIEFFMAAFLGMGRDVRHLRDVRIACVGEATAKALLKYGLIADLVPEDFRQEGFVQAFKHLDLKDRRFLIPRPREAREVFETFLRAQGAEVEPLMLYMNRVPRGSRDQIRMLFEEQGGVDLLTFASSSAVDHFFKILTPAQHQKWVARLPLAAMGPVTAEAAQKWKVRVAIQPKRHTVADLVEATVKWAQKNRKRIKML